MNRESALALMHSKISQQNLRKHILASEAVMRGLAKELSQDEEEWGLVGLLHDLDYEETKNAPEKHALVTAGWLMEIGIPQKIIDAIKAHNSQKPADELIEKAIYCTDPTTGFVVACALIRPEKNLDGVDAEFMKNRMKEKRFAAGVSREKMQTCSSLGLSLERFFEIALTAMKGIRTELGL